MDLVFIKLMWQSVNSMDLVFAFVKFTWQSVNYMDLVFEFVKLTWQSVNYIMEMGRGTVQK